MTFDLRPPVDVRVVLDDETEIPVQTVYRGVVGRDHMWAVVEPVPFDRVRGMKIGMLPPGTAVSLEGHNDR